MAGLESAMQEQPQPERQGMGMEPAPEQSPDGFNLTPEQRSQLSKFVTMGKELLVNESFMQKAVAMLEKFPAPEEAMAQIGNAIASRIYLQSEEEGNPVDMGVVIIGGSQLMQKIGEFAEAAGAEIGPESVEDAFYRAADLFRETLDARGLIDQDDLAQAYGQLREQYGDDTFEQVNQKVSNVRNAALPQRGAA